MSVLFEKITLDAVAYASFLTRLKEIFSTMDKRYKETSVHYGFACTGCEDNCCLTRFHHHTLLEYFYLLEGFQAIDPFRQVEIAQRAAMVCEEADKADHNGEIFRLMCPLNVGGLCLLYEHRPMICRLHGLPHELRCPGRMPDYGPGCEAFTSQCGELPYYPFDRTPFYLEMARLEKELKEATGFDGKLKLTVAEMIGSINNK